MHSGYLYDLLPSPGAVVQYHLVLDTERIHLNAQVGRHLRLVHTGAKACTFCGRKVKKLFANGSCYPCFRDRAANDLCVVKPHECHYETCREPEWGDAHCMVPTYVYIARSSDVKVGISRNLPGRWMEQGAVEAMPIALLPNRKAAGELEVHLAQHLPDRTDWRKMLRGEVADAPLEAVRDRILALIPAAFQAYLLSPADQTPAGFQYPVSATVARVISLDPEKAPVTGRLVGIKAKYLILATGTAEDAERTLVVNVPKYAGYHVEIEFSEDAGVLPASGE